MAICLRHYKKKKVSRYTETDFQSALNEIHEDNVSVRSAAKKYIQYTLRKFETLDSDKAPENWRRATHDSEYG